MATMAAMKVGSEVIEAAGSFAVPSNALHPNAHDLTNSAITMKAMMTKAQLAMST